MNGVLQKIACTLRAACARHRIHIFFLNPVNQITKTKFKKKKENREKWVFLFFFLNKKASAGFWEASNFFISTEIAAKGISSELLDGCELHHANSELMFMFLHLFIAGRSVKCLLHTDRRMPEPLRLSSSI